MVSVATDSSRDRPDERVGRPGKNDFGCAPALACMAVVTVHATRCALQSTPTGYSDDGTLTVAIYTLPVMLCILAVLYLVADRYLTY